MNKRAIATLVGAGAVIAIFHPHWLHPTRYGQLKCVINHHTGFAHMTRGMNMNTINALRHAAEPQDIPVLVRMLDDRDHVAQMTAAQTLARMNEPGLRALRQELATMDRQTGSNFYRYQAVQEAITDSGDEASVAYVQAISAGKSARIQKQHEEQRINDAQIQANSLRLQDPSQKQSLGRQEREAAFQRSVKAAGLDGPRTPQQEELYKRMYNSMVLNQDSGSNAQQ